MNSRLSSFSEIIGVNFEEFICVSCYLNAFRTPLMNCAECLAEYIQPKFGVRRIVPGTSVVMGNLLCSVILICEGHHGLCNQEATGKHSAPDRQCR